MSLTHLTFTADFCPYTHRTYRFSGLLWVLVFLLHSVNSKPILNNNTLKQSSDKMKQHSLCVICGLSCCGPVCYVSSPSFLLLRPPADIRTHNQSPEKNILSASQAVRFSRRVHRLSVIWPVVALSQTHLSRDLQLCVLCGI